MWEFQYIFYPYFCWSFSILSPLPLLEFQYIISLTSVGASVYYLPLFLCEFQYIISPYFCVSFSILSPLIFVWVSVYYLPLPLLEFQYIISLYFCWSFSILSPLISVGVSICYHPLPLLEFQYILSLFQLLQCWSLTLLSFLLTSLMFVSPTIKYLNI